MDKDNDSKVIDFNLDTKETKKPYDEKKLNRLLKVFDSMYDQMVGTYIFDDPLEFMNMKILMENYAISFYNRLLKTDKTALPFVLLMKILDKLNAAEIRFSKFGLDEVYGILEIPDLPVALLENFPSYYKRINPTTSEEILDYFIEEVDLDKYNAEVLYLFILVMSGIILDNEASEKYEAAIEKVLDSVAKYDSDEIPNDLHLVFGKIYAQYIRSFIEKDTPLDEIVKKVEKVNHLYGAYAAFISFLTANDEIDQAYDYIKTILEPNINKFDRKFEAELGISMALNSFLYVALCFDKLDYFKEIFPEFLKLNHTSEDITVLLLLYKKCASPEEYENYMKSLQDSQELNNKVKKQLRSFYLKHKTSRY